LQNHCTVNRCYNLTVTPGWSIPERANLDFHLIFIKGGAGAYYMDGIREEFVRGKIIFVSDRLPHSAEQDTSNPPQFISVRFYIRDNTTLQPIRRDGQPFSISTMVGSAQRVGALFETLHKHFLLRNDPIHHYSCSSLLHQILCRVFFNFHGQKNRTQPLDMRIEQVQAFIETNPFRRESLESLAAMAGLTPKYFSALFRQQIGISPKGYQVNTRLNYARFLLEETHTSIKKVALDLGYPDQYIFSKQFKNHFGYPPRDAHR